MARIRFPYFNTTVFPLFKFTTLTTLALFQRHRNENEADVNDFLVSFQPQKRF